MTFEMHMNLDRKDGGSTQVLPQFRDTKLGNLRLWDTAASDKRQNVETDWKTVATYFVVNVVCFVASLILLVAYTPDTVGWIVFGVWGLLTLVGVGCAVTVVIASQPPRKKSSDAIEMEDTEGIKRRFKKILELDDPVMNRAMTYIVYHGHDDCEECRRMRHRDEFEQRVKSWSKVGSASVMETFPYESVPTPTIHATYKPKKPNTKEVDHALTKEHPIMHYSGVISKDYCYDTSADDEIYNEVTNNNCNNNRIIPGSSTMPTVVITPPDVTQSPDDVTTGGGPKKLGDCIASRSPTKCSSDDSLTEARVGHCRKKHKPNHSSGISRRGVVSRHSSVAKRKRGLVQISLQRMIDQNLIKLNNQSQRDMNLDKPSTSHHTMSPDSPDNCGYDVAIAEKKAVVISVESSL